MISKLKQLNKSVSLGRVFNPRWLVEKVVFGGKIGSKLLFFNIIEQLTPVAAESHLSPVCPLHNLS